MVAIEFVKSLVRASKDYSPGDIEYVSPSIAESLVRQGVAIYSTSEGGLSVDSGSEIPGVIEKAQGIGAGESIGGFVDHADNSPSLHRSEQSDAGDSQQEQSGDTGEQSSDTSRQPDTGNSQGERSDAGEQSNAGSSQQEQSKGRRGAKK